VRCRGRGKIAFVSTKPAIQTPEQTHLPMISQDTLKNEPPNHFELPYRLRRLADLAYNLWWTWHPQAGRIFKMIDPQKWEAAGHNPVQFLRQVERERFDTVTKDRYYLDLYDQVLQSYDDYMDGAEDTWFSRHHPDQVNRPVAYFSTEFGLHESLPIYAGGLGILSGDHLKEASDLGLPLVAVGFLYTEGYFTQRILEDGWQEATYAKLSFPDLPVLPVLDQDNDPLLVNVDLADRTVHARLWRIQVGRVALYMLDSDVEQNRPDDRRLTARLYTSDLELRLAQEIILGIGGVRALRSLGYNPSTWHMNEGHSAFLLLELIREKVTAGSTLAEATEAVRRQTAFTTHTPVPAGHDRFPQELIDKYFSDLQQDLGIDKATFFGLGGRENARDKTFGMTTLALRITGKANGVSKLHGKVAREMWSPLWPKRAPSDIPISHITNGVHTGTWLARRMRSLYNRYFEEGWAERVDLPETWSQIEKIPDRELWEARRHLKRKLVAYARERVRNHWRDGRIHPVQVVASGVLLDPYALTIGFARRFATYKRANLVLSDPARLLALVNNPDRPVQIIFAGKAHPADEPGKRLIQAVYQEVKRAENGGRLVFLEDYDMNLARYLLQGVDIWLNTPRRPNEASGTSGQKAAMNGALNFSILDGWWPEAYNGLNGWAIGEGEEFEDPDDQDAADAEDLYRVLEDEIIPLYYVERSADGLPGEWLRRVRESIRTISPEFSMRRMLKEYIHQIYLSPVIEGERV
jgi:starch phosphorylase